MKKLVIILCLILWPLNFILNYSKIDFESSTIFKHDYQAEQLILRNISLYPNPLMARTFQNKARIYLDKFVKNFFVLIDPNYYFFASHPSPLPLKLNLFKYPFPAIIYAIVGIFYFKDMVRKNLILASFLMLVVTLSTLTNFEGYEIILYIPVSLVIVHGINKFYRTNKKVFNYYAIFFIIFASAEVIRSFFNR